MTDTPEGAERRYPDKYALRLNRESLDSLLDSKKAGRPHIPTFARRLLRGIVDEGMLYGTEPKSSIANLRTAKLDDGQLVFISLDTRRDEPGGYMAVEVIDGPPSDKAILAAMTAKAALPTDIKRLRQALQILEAPLKDTVTAHKLDTRKRIKEESSNLASPDFLSFLGLYDIWSTLEYVVALLRHNKPGFDDLSHEDQLSLIEEACEKINEFLGSLEKLQAFLSYGAPKRKLTPSKKDPQRDVDAAVLRDVDGLTHSQIGERLNVPPPSNYHIKGEYQTVRRMIERGRRILETAFGKEGWQQQAEAMRAEKTRRRSLSEEEQLQQWLAEMMSLVIDDVPLEKARTAFKEVFEGRERGRSE